MCKSWFFSTSQTVNCPIMWVTVRPKSNKNKDYSRTSASLCSHSAKIKITRRPARGRGALSSSVSVQAHLLLNFDPYAVAWVWISVCPCCRHQPRSNAWTALRRPLAGRLRSLNHPDRTTYLIAAWLSAREPNRCRGAKQYFTCLLTIAHFLDPRKSANRALSYVRTI